MRVIHKTHRKITIQGIDNHEVTGLDVVTAATLLNTSQGKVIGIFNEYAYLGKGSSIHSSGQLEWFKTNVDGKSVKVGGTQLISTLDGYSVPLLIKDGLAYATSLGKPTDQDMDTYPHVFFTSPDEWDPSVLDHDPPHLDGLDPSQVPDQPFGDPMFDAYGDFNEHIIANLNILLDAPPEDCGSYTEISSVFTANIHQSLALISKDDPITCAVYAKKHDLLDTTGWKHLKRYAKTSKRLIRDVKQSRIRQVRASA